MDKSICVFLDLLGFSDFTKIDPAGALSMLSNYQQIISQGIAENKISNVPSKPEMLLSNLTAHSLTDSFENFLPFSDSIFITSNNADLFILQLSNFLFRSFSLSSPNFYKTENHLNPYERTYVAFKKQSLGQYIQEEKKKNCFPVLFRGGISIEAFKLIDIQCIRKSEPTRNPILIGKAVVSAVHLEKIVKGPRLVCQHEIFQLLQEDLIKLLFQSLPKTDEVELLWPGIAFIDKDDCLAKLYEFDHMFVPATTLWKTFNHENFGIHYYEFMKLVIRSTLNVYSFYGYKLEAADYIEQVINQQGLKDKAHDLLPI